MSGSAGSAEREMDVASEAISFHLNELKQVWVGVAQDLFQSETIKVFVDSLTIASEAIAALLKPIELVSSGVSALSNLFEGLSNLLTGGIAKGSSDFADKIGKIGTVATIAAAGMSFKNIGRDKMFSLLNMPITKCVLSDMTVFIGHS